MDYEHEILDVDVLFVGAGPACLAGAIHLANLVQVHNEKVRTGEKKGPPLDEVTIAVLEKGAEVGAHILSGAVLDPKALAELIPDFIARGAPLETPVQNDRIYFLTGTGTWRLPIVPPSMRNHGHYIISLSRFTQWLAEQAEQRGVDIFPGFPGSELLYQNNQVVGVRTGDRGLDKNANPKSNYEPGVDLQAKVTVLGEGVRGSLTKQLVQKKGLDQGRSPQIYSTAIKELWEVPAGRLPEGSVIHTLGFPLANPIFGGGFIYGLSDTLIAVGLVVGLDYGNPHLDLHAVFQCLKTHPFLRALLKNGQLVRYGAKAIPEGGVYAMPKLAMDGLLLVGDSAGFLNAQRLKGIHLAMKSGMLAAETIVAALLAGDYSQTQLAGYEQRIRNSWAWEELYRSRNFRGAFQKGLWSGLFHSGLQILTGGQGLRDFAPQKPDHKTMRRQKDGHQARPKAEPAVHFDNHLTYDKLTDVYYSGTQHDEDQPVHLKVADPNICATRCAEEYGNPCRFFCPAHVYEIVEREDNQGKRLQINATNCVHCKTCDIMDPYGIITWLPPEGGGGPNYINM